MTHIVNFIIENAIKDVEIETSNEKVIEVNVHPSITLKKLLNNEVINNVEQTN